VLLLLARASRPRWGILGRTAQEGDDDTTFRDMSHTADAHAVPGMLILRFDSQLFFANANVFKQAVLDSLDAAEPPPDVVLIDVEGITDIDSTALAMLSELRTELAGRDVDLWIARLRQPLKSLIDRYEPIHDAHPSHDFPTVRAAVDAFEHQS
jgi:SulP family sulfate permease